MNMQKSLPLIILAIILVTFISIYAFFGDQILSQFTKQSGTTAVTEQAIPPGGVEGESLWDLLAKGGAQECTYTDLNNSTRTGKIYSYYDKMLVDIDDSQANKSHLVLLDSVFYIWTDGEDAGTSVPMAANENLGPLVAETGVNFDVVGKYTFDCTEWTLDEAMFELPLDLPFNTVMMVASTPVATDAVEPSAQ